MNEHAPFVAVIRDHGQHIVHKYPAYEVIRVSESNRLYAGGRGTWSRRPLHSSGRCSADSGRCGADVVILGLRSPDRNPGMRSPRRAVEPWLDQKPSGSFRDMRSPWSAPSWPDGLGLQTDGQRYMPDDPFRSAPDSQGWKSGDYSRRIASSSGCVPMSHRRRWTCVGTMSHTTRTSLCPSTCARCGRRVLEASRSPSGVAQAPESAKRLALRQGSRSYLADRLACLTFYHCPGAEV